LVRTEHKFSVACLIFHSALHEVFERDLFIAGVPCMGQDGIVRNISGHELMKAEMAIIVATQKAHSEETGSKGQIEVISLKKPN
jgi:hypothetical protein